MNLFAVRRLASAHRPPWGGSAMDEERRDGWFRAGHGRRSMPAHKVARPGNGRDAIAPNSRDVPASACASSMTSQPVTGGRAGADAMSSVRAVALRAASPSALAGAGGPSPARSGCRTKGIGAGAARRNERLTRKRDDPVAKTIKAGLTMASAVPFPWCLSGGRGTAGVPGCPNAAQPETRTVSHSFLGCPAREGKDRRGKVTARD